jgi:hypothetical protein
MKNQQKKNCICEDEDYYGTKYKQLNQNTLKHKMDEQEITSQHTLCFRYCFMPTDTEAF